jgi:hypothetical protein
MGIFSATKDKIFGTKTTEPAATSAASTATTVTTAAAKAVPVDVEAVIDAIVKAKGQKSNWRVSIVDLMKALDLDSSLAARKELAAELKYTGTDPDGSAEKNIWLHKALMKALAENGGKVPKELLK